MSGRFSRRNPASVQLDDDHVAMLDAIGLVCYGAPRTAMVRKAIALWIPLAIEDIKKRDSAKAREVLALAEKLKTHVEAPPLPVGVVDLSARRDERIRRRLRERL